MELLLNETNRYYKEKESQKADFNASLLLSKYVEPEMKDEKNKDKKNEVLNFICEKHNNNAEKYAKKVKDSIDSMFSTLDNTRKRNFVLTTNSNIAINLSQNCIVENSAVSFYQPYGFAYLPGSSIKGMTRAYAVHKGYDKKFINQLFGDDSEDGSTNAGAVIFYDSISTDIKLDVDISNCHHSKYYGESSPSPIDREQPNPVLFVAMKAGTTFNFYLSLRPGIKEDSKKLLEQAEMLLKEALSYFGIGAKTSLGYGIFKSEQQDTNIKLEKDILISTEIELETPAFLAGADIKNIESPALRASTLKGLLRWWWRRRYFNDNDKINELAKKLQKPGIETLAELERYVWGGIKQGKDSYAILSPIKIIISTIKQSEQTQYIPPAYSAYGVAAMRVRGQMQSGRKMISVGSKWKVDFIVPNDVIKEELQKALYCLEHYGGVGAKTRKGFGSFKLTYLTKEHALPKDKNYSSGSYSRSFRQPEFANNFSDALNKISENIMKRLELKYRQPHNTVRAKAGKQKYFGYINGRERYASPIHFSLHISPNNGKYTLMFTMFHSPDNSISYEQEQIPLKDQNEIFETIKKFAQTKQILHVDLRAADEQILQE